MAPRRCCCYAGCVQFFDPFDRPDADTLGPDYQICGGDEDSWSIDDERATNNDDSRAVVLHANGSPLGIFAVSVQLPGCVGTKYRIHILHGTQADPCDGPGSHIAELEVLSWVGDPELGSGSYKITLTGTGRSYTYETVVPVVGMQVCVENEGIYLRATGQAVFDVLGVCGELPTGYWFAISAENRGYFHTLSYSEHYDANQNPDCPECFGRVCFSDEKVVVGYRITVSGIQNDACSSCLTEFTEDVFLEDSYFPCSGDIQGTFRKTFANSCVGFDDPDDPLPYQYNLFFRLRCNDPAYPDKVTLEVTVGGITSSPGSCNGTSVFRVFDQPVNAEAVGFSYASNDTGCSCGGFFASQCCFANAIVTAEPLTVDGCCYTPGQFAMAMAQLRASAPVDPGKQARLELLREKVEKRTQAHNRLISWISFFRAPTDAGLGDATFRLIRLASNNPELRKRLKDFLKLCGCQTETAISQLNQLHPFSKVHGKCAQRINDSLDVTFVTSLSPLYKHRSAQHRALASWKRFGVRIVAVNKQCEINVMQEAYPFVDEWVADDDQVTWAGRTTQSIRSLFRTCQSISTPTFIVNADIEIEGSQATLLKYLPGELPVLGIRWNYTDSHSTAREFQYGFDVLGIAPQHAARLPADFPYGIGQPVWDYTAPLLLSNKFVVIHEPLFYHRVHPLNWSQEAWDLGAEYFARYIGGTITSENTPYWRQKFEPNMSYDTESHCYVRRISSPIIST